MIFGTLIIGYLFLGGAGAGFSIVLSFFELDAARQARCQKQSGSKHPLLYPREFFALCWPFCLAILVFAVLCLLIDLGRLDRALSLLTAPSVSALTIGTYSLLITIGCSAAFAAMRMFGRVVPSPWFVRVLGTGGIISGIVTAVYTGVLLMSLASVLFWDSYLLPALFLLSALSTGCACALLGTYFVNTRRSLFLISKKLIAFDKVLIALELLILAIYFGVAYVDPATTVTAQAFLVGEASWLFWGGLVMGGLVVPLVLEVKLSAGNYQRQILWLVLLVLIGGLILRICIVQAASYDITQTTPMVYQELGI